MFTLNTIIKQSTITTYTKTVSAIEQLRHPNNDVIIFLTSDWSLLVISSDDQSEARKIMTPLIQLRDC